MELWFWGVVATAVILGVVLTRRFKEGDLLRLAKHYKVERGRPKLAKGSQRLAREIRIELRRTYMDRLYEVRDMIVRNESILAPFKFQALLKGVDDLSTRERPGIVECRLLQKTLKSLETEVGALALFRNIDRLRRDFAAMDRIGRAA
jgi:hypothetical protein